MTNEKAIEYWVQFKAEIHLLKKHRDSKTVKMFEEQETATDIAIEALEKQIPKQLQSRSAGSCYCGNCHSMFSEQMYGLDLIHCPWCGQMVYWGKVE